MAILREFVLATAQVVDMAFGIYTFIVIGRAIISWVNPDPYNPIVRFLHNATDPVLTRIRRILPLNFSGIDFSPIVLLLALSFLQRIVMALFVQFASTIG